MVAVSPATHRGKDNQPRKPCGVCQPPVHGHGYHPAFHGIPKVTPNWAPAAWNYRMQGCNVFEDITVSILSSHSMASLPDPPLEALNQEESTKRVLSREEVGEEFFSFPELIPPPLMPQHDAEHTLAAIICPCRSLKPFKTSCCYPLLVQDPGPVHPGPHIRDVQLLIEGSVLCTQLCHTLMELLDAAKERRHSSVSLGRKENQGRACGAQMSLLRPRLLVIPLRHCSSAVAALCPGALHLQGCLRNYSPGGGCRGMRAAPSQLQNNSSLLIST